jgi:phage/plasmid-associated DNA primase
MSGIFNWALRGYYEWEKYGLNEPKVILDELSEYRKSNDTVAEFVEDHCIIGEDLVESSDELWELFSRTQRDIPYRERTQRKRLLERLSELGYHKIKAPIRGSRKPLSAVMGLRIVGLDEND